MAYHAPVASLTPPLSRAGYLAIFLFGIGTGLYVLPPDPYFYEALYLRSKPTDAREVRANIEEKKRKAWKAKPGKLANVLGSYAVMWWVAYFGLRWLGMDVSRRVVSCSRLTCAELGADLSRISDTQANLPYVIWIAAFNTTFLFVYLLVNMWAASSPLTRATGAPAIFDSFNRNGLVVFLVVRYPLSLARS